MFSRNGLFDDLKIVIRTSPDKIGPIFDLEGIACLGAAEHVEKGHQNLRENLNRWRQDSEGQSICQERDSQRPL